jgi:nucleotide-binding universal stress UspA family protein
MENPTEGLVLLVPFDVDELSQDVLSAVMKLARRLGAAVIPIHVYTLPHYGYPGTNPLLTPDFIDRVTAAAQDEAERVAAAKGAPTPLVREGDPATEILRAAEELRPAMIVMGTHGRRGLSHLFLGSVAERVIRESRVSVLTLRFPDEAAGAFGEQR